MPNPTPPRVRQPRFVQAARFIRRDMTLVSDAHERYGDVFQIHFQKRRWNVLTNPEHVKQVFTAPANVLHAGRGNEILGPALGPNSLLLLDEDRHLRQRRLLLPSFHGEKLALQMSTMEAIAEREVQLIPRGKPFSMRDHGQSIALEVILEVVLGTDSTGAEHDLLAKTVLDLLDWIASPLRLAFSGLVGPQHALVQRMYRPILAPLDAAINDLINSRRSRSDLEQRSDILSMLLLARDEDGSEMTNAEIRDELVTMIVAGHETTSTALAWTFERLARQPEDLARLSAESVTEETEYTRAVAQEALRLRPVLDFVVRAVNEPIEIAGYEFLPGDTITPCIKLIHLRPDIYPDPEAFKPERWLGTKPGTYTWIPFGGGVRRCIGLSFAMAEMEIVMRAMARAGRIEPVGEPEQAVTRFITSSPSRGGELIFAS